MIGLSHKLPEEVQNAIVDSIVSVPQEFHVGDHIFFIYPLTLGKLLLLEKIVRKIDNSDSKDLLKICTDNLHDVVNLLSILLSKDKSEIDNATLLHERAELLKGILDPEQVAEILALFLSQTSAETIAEKTGMTEQHLRMREIAQNRSKDTSYINFGGNTLYGLILDRAAERYGWTKEYIVWGIDFVSLQLMLRDAMTSVYVDKDSMTGNPKPLNADDPANIEKIINMNWD